MTKALDIRPEITLGSFDRFFPNQDTMPKGGFGNLIALPFQKRARENGNSVFVDETFTPYPDQWKFLASLKKLSLSQVEAYVSAQREARDLFPVSHGDDLLLEREPSLEDEELPWKKQSQALLPLISSPLPDLVTVVLSNQIYIDSTGLPPVLRNRILRIASFSNPEFYQAQAMRLPTWGKRRILFCYEVDGAFTGLPIGCLDDLYALFSFYKIDFRVQDERTHGVLLDVQFTGKLFEEQKKAASALIGFNTGVLSATTAFGKTVLALSLIAERKVNTLVLVHRKQLMEQWVARAVQFLAIRREDIGVYCGSKKRRTGILDIVVIQSVSRKGFVEEWLTEYGQVIVDECHHISAFSFEQAVRQSPAFYKRGLSATVRRKDGQHPIIFMNLGPIRYAVSAKKQAAKSSFSHTVIPRDTEFIVEDPASAAERIQEVFRLLWNNKERNALILQDLIPSGEQNKKILVLSERREHLELLEHLLGDSVDHLFLLRGGMGKKQIRAVMEGIESVDPADSIVILATGRYLGEGFDLPYLDTLFLTFPISWKGTLTQYAGRLQREYQGKEEVIIYDYADRKVPVLARMFQKRLKGYSSLGFQILSKKEHSIP